MLNQELLRFAFGIHSCMWACLIGQHRSWKVPCECADACCVGEPELPELKAVLGPLILGTMVVAELLRWRCPMSVVLLMVLMAFTPVLEQVQDCGFLCICAVSCTVATNLVLAGFQLLGQDHDFVELFAGAGEVSAKLREDSKLICSCLDECPQELASSPMRLIEALEDLSACSDPVHVSCSFLHLVVLMSDFETYTLPLNWG